MLLSSHINLLKIYVFLDGEKIFGQTSVGVLLLDLSLNRFLQFESFPAYVANYFSEKPISSYKS